MTGEHADHQGEHAHPLAGLARSMPRQETTAPDPDLVAAIAALRVEWDNWTLSLFQGLVTPAESERMAALFEDFAGVIRLGLGTERMRGELEENGRG